MNGRVVHIDRSPHSAIPRMFYFNSSRLRDPRRKLYALRQGADWDLRHSVAAWRQIEQILTRERGCAIGRQTNPTLPTAATFSRISREITRSVSKLCRVGASEN